MKLIAFHLLTALFLVSAMPGLAQDFRQEVFHKGTVTLSDGQQVSGMLKYDLNEEVVQLETDRLLVFAPNQVTQFTFLDSRTGRNYTFHTFDYDRHGTQYDVPTFFEVLLTGRVNLLFRDRIYISTSQSYDIYGNPLFPRAFKKLETNYYLQYPSGRIRYFDKAKRSLQTLLADKWKEVKAYIKEENLRTSDDRDIRKIIEYYNSLFPFREFQSPTEK